MQETINSEDVDYKYDTSGVRPTRSHSRTAPWLEADSKGITRDSFLKDTPNSRLALWKQYLEHELALEGESWKSVEKTGTTNPYTSMIESRHNAMTSAFMRSLLRRKTVPTDLPDQFSARDLLFGQKYQSTDKNYPIVVTNQRKLPDILSGTRECIICADSKDVGMFPGAAVTNTCDHPPSTCLDCIAISIKSDIESKLWNEIKCPECGTYLQYDDVQRFANSETKERYQNLSFRYAMSEAENFVWCTSGCGSGQVHDSGVDQPIVTCSLCHHRSCFLHKVAWHQNLTCGEYDSLQADPVNFRSYFELENEAAEEAAAARRAQEDADREFARSLIAREKQTLKRQRLEREQRQAQEARGAQLVKEQKERAERIRSAQVLREEAARRKGEEEASIATVGRTTKPCPGCKVPIEKSSGWAGFKCKHEFCWDCLVGYWEIVSRDNTAHQRVCPWHSSNLRG
ncbi:hypothetical protein B0T17DRAFT_481281 [Bombardia bombarda]|uniref:RBR-type E3 ubiquitin transferase n=1 Tax=Bombardia bombarda TaxID=252184 RepID=A0AA39XI27_9PEZI|nr:hypothetical protein B0T17DRAFT_481281 [Bombardia bombarda]